ncbi:MAG TPA: hypothetical protein VFF30_02460 [Nitrososphaerales archaeon]|nr:hypothetical protein [Nitrososphaerales archaeon]
MPYTRLRDSIWLIGAIIYVLGMFPLFYFYQYSHSTDYGLIDMIATAGAFIVMAQAFLGAFDDKKTPESVSKPKLRQDAKS